MKGFVKESASIAPPVFQKVNETSQGGFRLDVSTLTDGDTVVAGTPLGFDESTRVAKVVKTAVLQANATDSATAYRVEKGHHFKVGDYLAYAVGDEAYAITDIDTSNADYDELTVGTTLGVALTAGAVFFQSSATGASAAAYAVEARGVSYLDVTVETGADIAAVIDGTVYERRAPGYTDAIKALLPKIFFSQSF